MPAYLAVEPYGLEISPELASLARRRLPHWAGRIWVGNAAEWEPPRRFDVVRTGLDYVPAPGRRALLERLLSAAGRVVIGVHDEERETHALGRETAVLGRRRAVRACVPETQGRPGRPASGWTHGMGR